MEQKVNFTKAFIEGLSAPEGDNRVIYRDAKVPGLQLRVTPSGVKTFFSRRRIKGGESERITLGRFPDMTIEMARKKADAVNAQVSDGKNPADVKRSLKAELTFGDLFAEYLDRHAKVKKRSWARDEANYRLYLESPLGKKKLSQITRQHIGKIHSDITNQVKGTKKKASDKPQKKSGGTANRILALVSSVFGWGVATGQCETNPARGLKKNPERSRDRFLQSDELPKFFQSLEKEENPIIRDYILLSLLTGARRENVLSMRWEQISFERREWRIPRTKNDDPQTIPLGEEIIQILNERKDNGSEYVFPGTGETGHLAEPRRGWERILKRAGIKDLRIHDLRRTFGSWQAKTGASLTIVGKSLGHKSAAATAVYARLDLDPVRKSAETATSAMLEAAGVKKSAEIVPLGKRRSGAGAS